MDFEFEEFHGCELKTHLDDLAKLRLSVFAAFPYLYDGTLESEQQYLKRFAALEGAIMVGCFFDGKIVGAATGAPVVGQFDEFVEPLSKARYNIGEIFYCGESVLLAPYRGNGVGHVFFDARERQARKLGLAKSCFLSVVRTPDDPRRPVDYRPLDDFWRARSYQPLVGVTATFDWRVHGSDDEEPHEMQYWMRDL